MNSIVDSFVPGLANHVWQSTAFAAAAWLLATLLRKNPARLRYGIWLAASIKFLIPFSLLAAVGPLLPQPGQPIAPAVYTAMHVAEQPFSGNTWTPAPSVVPRAAMWGRVAASIPTGLIGLWLAGSATVFVLWGMGWRRASTFRHKAVPITLGREFEILRRLEDRFTRCPRLLPGLRLSREQVEPSLHGMLRPVLVWPVQLSARLNDEHIEVIMTHELLHARRFDNLTAALHMLVEALFWFHPLVWWMERRLIEEREQACDEAVVEWGGNPDVYAESLLETSRFCLESGLACAAGVTGAELKKRVVAIMTTPARMRMTWPKKLLVLAAAVCGIAAPVFLGQATSAGSQLPEFEVASIRPSNPRLELNGLYTYPGGTVVCRGCGAHYLIMEALNLRPWQISGAPAWADDVRGESFEIQAKSPESSLSSKSNPALAKLPPNDEQRQMLLSLLASRFQFKFHRVTKEGTVFRLTRSSRPLKLKPSSDKNKFPWAGGMDRFLAGGMRGINISMPQLAQRLSGFLGSPVLDRTGIDGSFDFEYRFGDESNEEDIPSTVRIAMKGIGLDLVHGKGPVETIVVDHIERPSEN